MNQIFLSGTENSDRVFDEKISIDLATTTNTFFFLLLYVLSQCFMIPIMAIGPSWTIWPRLADLAWAGMVFTWLIGGRAKFDLSPLRNELFKLLLVLLGILILAFVHILVVNPESEGTKWGLHSLLRAIQFVVLYKIVISIPFDYNRINILKKITDITLILVCLGVILLYFRIIEPALVVSQLPNSTSSGAWLKYYEFSALKHIDIGYGTISYNHAYTALQIMLLFCLRLILNKGVINLTGIILIILALFSCFLTGSRAGLAALVVYLATQVIQRPAIAISLGLVVTAIFSIIDFQSFGATVERQTVLVSGDSSDKNVSHRIEIWNDFLDYLNSNNAFWIFGGGLGGAANISPRTVAAHLLPLHITVETGIIGLTIFCAIMLFFLVALRKGEEQPRPLFWCTVALIFSSITQETFYPMPAFGHFCGLFLVICGIALEEHIRQ
jgi:hypothetical protein